MNPWLTGFFNSPIIAAAYQIFCGLGIVKNWHVPDHTKIKKFRSRLSEETQRKLTNQIAVQAVKLGFGDCGDIDIDSTIQEANMTYPADSVLLKKLGLMSNKVAHFLNKNFDEYINTFNAHFEFVWHVTQDLNEIVLAASCSICQFTDEPPPLLFLSDEKPVDNIRDYYLLAHYYAHILQQPKQSFHSLQKDLEPNHF